MNKQKLDSERLDMFVAASLTGLFSNSYSDRVHQLLSEATKDEISVMAVNQAYSVIDAIEFFQQKGKTMNKQEAEKELERLVEIQAAMFCPAIRSKCRKDCICFVDEFEECHYKAGIEYVINVYCRNSMISDNLPGC